MTEVRRSPGRPRLKPIILPAVTEPEPLPELLADLDGIESEWVIARAGTTSNVAACRAIEISPVTFSNHYNKMRRDYLLMVAHRLRRRTSLLVQKQFEAYVMRAVEEVIALAVGCTDPRIRLMACKEILDRAIGKSPMIYETAIRKIERVQLDWQVRQMSGSATDESGGSSKSTSPS